MIPLPANPRLRPATEDEFFAAIGPQDCHPHILPGPSPYTSVFKLRYGDKEIGRIVGRATEYGPDEYFLAGSAS